MKVLITHEEIVEICKTIGSKITKDFEGKTPVVACVLKGACPFHSELIKHIDLPVTLDYIQVSSYEGTNSTGAIKIKKDFDFDILGKDVIIVEDIIDTGITLSNLDVVLKERNPNSITYVCMLDKPSRRKVDFDADIVGKVIDNLFVIGFGLDYNEQFRNLKDVCVYEGE